MGVLESYTVALPTFLLGTLVALAVVPLRWLSGLRCYYAASSKEGEAAAARSGGKRVRARGGKAGKESAQSNDYDLGGAESLVLAKLTLPVAAQLMHRGAFENLASACVFALCALACGQAGERLLGWGASLLPPALAFGAVFVALVMLAKVDLLSSTTSPTNKVIAAVWGVLGFSAALALHVLQPGGGRLLAWDLRRAAAAVGPTLHSLVQAAAGKALLAAGSKARVAGREVQPGDLPIPELAMADSTLHVLLALLASAFAVLLFAPAQRFVKSYFLQMRPPEWAADYVVPRPAATAGLTLHFVLPALTALLWVRPMFQELLQLSDRSLALVQTAALLVTAATMGANLRTLLQRYLDRALTGWHQLKHGSRAARGNKDEKRSLGDLIRMHCQTTNFLLGKVAVQTLAPSVLYLGLGLLLANSVLHPAEPGSPAAETEVLVQSCVGFLAFWTGLCWFAYSALMLWMYRTGVMQP